jgi:hypothetical protein
LEIKILKADRIKALEGNYQEPRYRQRNEGGTPRRDGIEMEV